MDKEPIFGIIYKECQSEIITLKEKASANFKAKIEAMGFRLVAEWIDWNFPILYSDIYLVSYKNALYSLSFSAGTKYIILNGSHKYARFDTLDLNDVQRRKTYYGYKINSENMIEREKEGKSSHPANKSLKYKDLLRVNKIAKLLNQD